MGILVVVGYKPKVGKEKEVEVLVKSHYDRLKRIDLVSERIPIIGQAKDGTFVEIFEWNSKQAIDEAHQHPEVQKMWGEFSEVCDYLPVGTLEEMHQLFSELKPI